MTRIRLTSATATLTAVLAVTFATVWTSCQAARHGDRAPGSAGTGATAAAALGTDAHRDQVMTSRFCADCHPAIYAEHQMNTHGRAFSDAEVRLATGNFDHGDCIRCHTPRPIFETGIGLNPQRRWYALEDGNSCMTCHWREGVDYSRFEGGADCITAFDPRVGTVEACASCHRNHGTPYQWELAPNGKESDRTCMTCHMKEVERPVAVGGPVRRVRSHVFPGARDVEHVARAYDYEAEIDGNEVVVKVTNVGAGHNFPTELKQRSVESLVVVRDVEGNEVARSRMVFRDPYKRPYGLHLQVNTQIPSGESRTHRVPIGTAAGTVECELHFKYYFPIEDNHPDLARRLELRRLAFDGITPSDKPVETEPEVRGITPEGISPEVASVANFVDFTRPPIGKTTFDLPTGSSREDIDALIGLFQFPAAEANRAAQARLVELGVAAVPQLIAALGSWDNKTFNQGMNVLRRIGAPAVPAVRAALDHDELYVRMHARQLLPFLPLPADKPALVAEVLRGLDRPNALDRASTCELLGWLGAPDTAEALRGQLDDSDPDVVRAAALALAALRDRESAPAMELALRRANFDELRIELAYALTQVGSPTAVGVLLQHLDHPDDLIREDCFERFVAATGQHLGYEPEAPRPQRLAAIARLQGWWATAGGAAALRRDPPIDPEADRHAWHLVETLGGGAGIVPAAEDDQQVIDELVGMGPEALPALERGLKFPPGFAAKRASILAALGRIGDRSAAPFVAPALRDPVLAVAAYAAMALETCGDEECQPALRHYTSRLLSAAAAGTLPASIPTIDPLLAQAARTRWLLGDEAARQDLVNLLLSRDASARRSAIATLSLREGDRKGYDPDGPADERRRAAARWQR
ncbi:MAG: HEAT repeat domain-containing protein [Planctomycetota bacterium]